MIIFHQDFHISFGHFTDNLLKGQSDLEVRVKVTQHQRHIKVKNKHVFPVTFSVSVIYVLHAWRFLERSDCHV